MPLHSVLAMRLIRRIVSLLPVVDEIENFRPTLLAIDDPGDQLSRLGHGQGR